MLIRRITPENRPGKERGRERDELALEKRSSRRHKIKKKLNSARDSGGKGDSGRRAKWTWKLKGRLEDEKSWCKHTEKHQTL